MSMCARTRMRVRPLLCAPTQCVPAPTRTCFAGWVLRICLPAWWGPCAGPCHDVLGCSLGHDAVSHRPSSQQHVLERHTSSIAARPAPRRVPRCRAPHLCHACLCRRRSSPTTNHDPACSIAAAHLPWPWLPAVWPSACRWPTAKDTRAGSRVCALIRGSRYVECMHGRPLLVQLAPWLVARP